MAPIVQPTLHMSSTRAFVFLEQCLPMLGVIPFLSGALWAGIIFSVSWLTGRARWMADAREVGALAVSLERRWGTPCLVAFVVSALAWAATLPSEVRSTPWLAALGAGLLALLLVHTSVAGRAARVAGGSGRATEGEGIRRFVLVVSLAVVAIVVKLRLPG